MTNYSSRPTGARRYAAMFEARLHGIEAYCGEEKNVRLGFVKVSKTKSAPLNSGLTASVTRSTSGRKSLRACSRDSENYPYDSLNRSFFLTSSAITL